jgi:phosphoribosylglycinamide formyltransferase-1
MTRRIAVLLSGSGRSLENLFVEIGRGALRAEVVLVISSNATAYGLERARQRRVPARALVPARDETPEAYSLRLFDALRKVSPDAVVLAGFLRIITIPPDFAGKVINIHPSLLPAFGGPGMYGHHVHEAVIESGARVSGCTVHYVTNDVDAGPIIEQRTVPVHDDDDASALAARVFEEEKKALPAALQLHLDGMLRIAGKRVVRMDTPKS